MKTLNLLNKRHIMFKLRYLILALLVGLWSCKEENNMSSNPSSIEQQYFKDYESPAEKWGFLNELGDISIDPIYDDLRDFNQSLCAANLKGKWGLINKKGESVIDFKYKQIYDVSENRTYAQDFDNQWYLINVLTKQTTPVTYTAFKPFQKGFSVVANKNNWGVIDINGNELIPAVYESIEQNVNNLILSKGQYQALVDTAGDTLLPFSPQKLKFLSSRFLSVKTDSDLTLYDLNNLKELLRGVNKLVIIDSESFLVKMGDKYAIYDIRTEEYKYLEYSFVDILGQGILKFKEGGRYGILNPDGSILSPAKYDMLNRFQESYLVYGINDYFGYINEDGSERTPPIFPLAWDFKNGFARVFDQRGIGYINKNFELQIPGKYFEVRDFYEGLARFQER